MKKVREVKPLEVVARRLLASVVILPSVALAYIIGFGLLVGLGAEQGVSTSQILNNGIMLGAIASLWFALSALTKK